jgi:hypothetical protein
LTPMWPVKHRAPHVMVTLLLILSQLRTMNLTSWVMRHRLKNAAAVANR